MKHILALITKNILFVSLIFSVFSTDAMSRKDKKHRAYKAKQKLSKGGIDCYETFKTAEQIGNIVDQAIYVVCNKNRKEPTTILSDRIGYQKTSSQLHKGFTMTGPISLRAPWGRQYFMKAGDEELRNQIFEEVQKRVTVTFLYESIDKIYSLLTVDGKTLPELVRPDMKDYLSDTVIKTVLKKHQARYKKEITDGVQPFIPVRAVATMVTAYLIKQD